MLASIQKIKSLTPISGADKIETAEMYDLGWKCVVKKDIYKVDDLVVFIEIDTLIPKWFLTDNEEDKEYIRLSTIKMKGQVSQGLILPTSKFNIVFSLGEDITNTLGVMKYEKPLPPSMATLVDGQRPWFIPKTDEINIESNPGLLDLLKDRPFYVTTKCDGTSMTVANHLGNAMVCSRNLMLKDNGNTYWQVAKKYNLDKTLPEGYAVQGELCGPGIQGNKLLLDEIKSWSDGMYNSKYRKEGIVVRQKRESMHRVSFKVVNAKYLLEEEKE